MDMTSLGSRVYSFRVVFSLASGHEACWKVQSPLNSKRSKGTEETEGHDKCHHRLLTREDDNIYRHPTPELPLSRVDSR